MAPAKVPGAGNFLTTLLACAGIPIDRPVGIATKQIEGIKA